MKTRWPRPLKNAVIANSTALAVVDSDFSSKRVCINIIDYHYDITERDVRRMAKWFTQLADAMKERE